MYSRSLTLAFLAVVSASPILRQREDAPFEFAVIFGDSYTDDGLGNYFFSHGLTLPSSGTRHDETDINATGGLVWAQYLEREYGVTVYDYGFGGSTCSNSIVSRSNPFFGGVAVPAVRDQTVPTYQNDSKSDLYKDVTADNTVYAIWIGTNDLGVGAFLTDNQEADKTPSDYVHCIWDSFDLIYASGGRRFILLNNNALDLLPLYQTPEKGGVISSPIWTNKSDYDQVAINQKMADLVKLTNQQMIDEAPGNLQARWPDADFTIFDVHQLATDMYYNPQAYFAPPYNSTWYYNDCPSEGCPADKLLDSYMWFDALHPSNKTEEYVAQEFINVAAKTSKYGLYF